MIPDKYLDILEKRHRKFFDVYRNHRIGDMILDLYTEFHVKNERFFFIDVLDVYEAHEYRFVKSFASLELQDIEGFTEWMKGEIENLVKPDTTHMCTTLTGVIIAENGIDPKVEKYINRYKYTRYFNFGIKGWCDIRLIGVDGVSDRVVANKKGREVIKDFEPVLPPPG
ncbi:MAG: hypothetical protein PWR06_2685 [Thermoanaerobacteraceae bacterium]|uniref:DUF8052 domain-containing protein n=1 Tax=Biomaibacter acetigenes TaxID=2316383 RepID=A0A3G2R2D8_9FIRM|nr:hypothetical protein [Biomaibacter acetigenes]AYO29532.1 hypothetical protein D2962_01945 [Biomaibacter acetigenes]MDK2879969.1 hypothetical protein [Thermoanaerobacteraceae bacterium]MDN5301375.1 hypothetical protein [Thermoanaerobacteraceae bacterium]MDN5313671.1 hypothetical protein [Thermoanaerobacteraceae bacterium]